MYGQFGVRAFVGQNHFNRWEEILATTPRPRETNILTNGYSFSVDYWIRPQNFRLEFFPELGYETITTSVSHIEETSSYSVNAFRAGLNMHFYPFDFRGDCDCPTFSKEGDFFQKGFFLLLRPSYSYFDKDMNADGATNSHRSGSAQFAGGIGLDFGISDLITVTPIIQYVYSVGVNWEGFSSTLGIIHIQPPDENASVTQFQAGLRLGIRLDY